MSNIDLYRLLGEEVPFAVIRISKDELRVLSNWDIYLANLAK